MGLWPGVLRAESIEVLETLDRPRESRDGLTGLHERSALGPALQRAVIERPPVAVALLDLDRFKRINDERGYEAGDEVLRGWASAVVATLRPTDVVVRWGGDELGVVMPGTTLEAAFELLERVHARVRSLGLTVSAGLVAVELEEPIGAVFERADHALYDAKRSGRDQTATAGRYGPS
jgi:diguanylate cyclase (GGDEF)-like protein